MRQFTDATQHCCSVLLVTHASCGNISIHRARNTGAMRDGSSISALDSPSPPLPSSHHRPHQVVNGRDLCLQARCMRMEPCCASSVIAIACGEHHFWSHGFQLLHAHVHQLDGGRCWQTAASISSMCLPDCIGAHSNGAGLPNLLALLSGGCSEAAARGFCVSCWWLVALFCAASVSGYAQWLVDSGASGGFCVCCCSISTSQQRRAMVRATDVACVEGHSALYQQSEASEQPVYCVAGSAQFNSAIQRTVARLCESQPWLTVIRVPVVWQGSGESAIREDSLVLHHH
jgi:hypothetical protein